MNPSFGNLDPRLPLHFTDTILGHSKNFTDTVWIVRALGQAISLRKQGFLNFNALETNQNLHSY